MKIALIGSSGYIGSRFFSSLNNQNHEVIRVTHSDILSSLFMNIVGWFKREKIECIFNCAGFVGKPTVDACEENQNACYQGNVLLPALLTDIAQKLNIKLIHISSGCIYNGFEKEWTEQDIPNFTFDSKPCGYYHGCKNIAEKIIRSYPDHYLLRIRLPFDSDLNNPRNYLSKIKNYQTLVNVKNSCTEVNEFVHLVSKHIFNLPFGIYNFTNPNGISTLEVYNLLLKYNIITDNKNWIDYETFCKHTKSLRSNCILSTKKLKGFGIEMRPITTAIEKCIISYIKTS